MQKAKRIYANQNRIIFEPSPRNSNNPYGIYNKEALFTALNDLSLPAFKLYLYLGGFQDMGSPLYLSKQDTLNTMHLDERSYFAAKKELKEKGYLIQDTTSTSSKDYVFIERPN